MTQEDTFQACEVPSNTSVSKFIAERLSKACTPLPDAIATISEVDARFEKLMEKIGV